MSRDVIKNLEGKIFLLRREIAEREIPERFFGPAREVIHETEVELLWTLFEEEREEEARALAARLDDNGLDRRTRLLRLLLRQPRLVRRLARRLKAML
jgi:hypothetical protein